MQDQSFYLSGATREKGVLLVHGLTGNPSEMKFVGKRLNRMGFTCYAPLLAGHAQDLTALMNATYEDWLASIRAGLERLKNEVDEVYIAGICVGGQLGLLAAHQMPGVVKGVAIYSPTLNYDGWSVPFYYPWAWWGIPFVAHLPITENPHSLTPSHYPFGFKSDRIRNVAHAKRRRAPMEGMLKPSISRSRRSTNKLRLNARFQERRCLAIEDSYTA